MNGSHSKKPSSARSRRSASEDAMNTDDVIWTFVDCPHCNQQFSIRDYGLTALPIAYKVRGLLYAPGRPLGRQHQIKLTMEQLILTLEKEQPKGDTQC